MLEPHAKTNKINIPPKLQQNHRLDSEIDPALDTTEIVALLSVMSRLFICGLPQVEIIHK